MSLLQDALDKAKQPEKKTPLTLKAASVASQEKETQKIPSKPEIEHEPRLDSIKFYETLDKKVEEEIDSIKPVRAKAVAPAAPVREAVPEPVVRKPEPVRETPVAPQYRPEPLPRTSSYSIPWKFPVVMAILFLCFLGVRSLVMQPAPAAPAPRQQSFAALAPKPLTPNGIVRTLGTTPSNSKSLSQVRFLLTGITSYEDGRAFALINNQAVAVGDHLRENATVTAITGDTVILDMQGQEIRLKL